MVVYIYIVLNKVKKMNLVYVWNGDRDKQALAEAVTYFCIEELMPRISTLDISIEFSDERQAYQSGGCVAVTRREFEIEISDKLSDDDIITTICHEMVHVKQYARNELPISGGVSYRTYEEYENQPHEVEAFQMEKILAEKFKINAK